MFRRIQPIDATYWSNRSADVGEKVGPNGRLLSQATAAYDLFSLKNPFSRQAGKFQIRSVIVNLST